jgi:3(or 17)beta-hydroxysteroid dehydrogenase
MRPARIGGDSGKEVGMGRVQDKVAIVTGAAKGLGEADARVLAMEGARVVMTDVDDERGRSIAQEIGADYVHQDVADEGGWTRLMAHVHDRYGRLDVLVNNAGIAIIANIETTTTEQWRRTLAVHLDSTFWGCQHAVRAMKERGGSIINMSSIVALQGSADYLAYAAAKGGIRSMTKAIAAHCRASGYAIRCNSVHPGSINTAMVHAALEHSAGIRLADAADQEALRLQLGLGEPLDVANMVLFLASDEAKHVNGAEMVVDNGATTILSLR